MIIQTKLRRDSAADWTSNDPTLAQAEIGIETDTDKLKIGDGSTAWTSLSYPYYLASEVDTISGDINTAYVAADVVVTSAFGAADTTLSGILSTEIDTDIATFSGTIDHDTIVNYSSTVHFTEASIDHTAITNIGSTSHADIDTHITTFTTHSGDADAHHDRSHTITSTVDHTGGNWKVIYSDGSGEWQELALGASGTVLTSQGESVAPIWV